MWTTLSAGTTARPPELLGLDGDKSAKQEISDLDAQIAKKSGKPPLEIDSVERVGAKKKQSKIA